MSFYRARIIYRFGCTGIVKVSSMYQRFEKVLFFLRASQRLGCTSSSIASLMCDAGCRIPSASDDSHPPPSGAFLSSDHNGRAHRHDVRKNGTGAPARADRAAAPTSERPPLAGLHGLRMPLQDEGVEGPSKACLPQSLEIELHVDRLPPY